MRVASLTKKVRAAILEALRAGMAPGAVAFAQGLPTGRVLEVAQHAGLNIGARQRWAWTGGLPPPREPPPPLSDLIVHEDPRHPIVDPCRGRSWSLSPFTTPWPGSRF